MASQAFIFDGNHENFQELVIDNSSKGVVLVNYWAANAGPCFKLWQALENLSKEFQGRFLLVNINTDNQKRLVREQGITSVPTLKIYQNGEIIESIYGAHTEISLRNTINQYAPSPRHPEVTRAIKEYQQGRIDDALIILVNAGIKNPENSDVHATTLKLLLREKRFDDIETYVQQLPVSVKTDETVGALHTHAKLMQLIEGAPTIEALNQLIVKEPENRDIRIKRVAVSITQDNYEIAFEDLLILLRDEKTAQTLFPKKVLFSLFRILGEDDALVKRYRREYQEIL